ncbi:MAG: restriction endonuclease subunit S [bacterium]|nr:restriction endonuclease subunit S [bacterium]
MELVELGTILEMVKGKKPVNQSAEKKDGYFPYVDIEAFETGIIKQYTDGEKCTPCDDGDILIVCDGSRSGLVGRAVKGYVGSTLAKISAKGLDDNYFFHFVQGKYALLNTKKKGTGTPHLNPELLKQQKLIVPSLSEQERIVSRIEEMFSQLDAGAETLKKTKAQLAVYRQAVLKEAFEGKLSGAEIISTTVLKDFIETPRYGTAKKCDYSHSDSSVAVYRIPNIDYNSGRISHEDIKYAEFESRELDGITLEKGDILIIRSNGSASLVGRASMINEFDTKGTFAGYLMRLRIKDQDALLPQFLLWYLQSHMARVYIENKAKSTSGVHNINSTEISQLPIPVLEKKEQERVIEAIESRLSVCDSIEKTVDNALLQAEAMRQSILKEAFEGRL